MPIVRAGLTCFLIIILLTEIQAQQFLVLEKMGTKKRQEYYAGDKIIFMLNEEEGFRTDEILALGDSSIIFETGAVPLKDIKKVSLSNRRGPLRGIGSTLVVAGLGYMIIDLFNKGITTGDIYLDGKVARSSAIIAGTGVALIFISTKKVKVRNNWRLRIVSI